MKKFPYESIFANLTIKPIVSAEKDKCLALASLNEIQAFLPNVNTATNLDLLPVAFNACVINRVNKNKDVVDTDTAIAMCPYFINKPINIEHDRKRVIGMILTAGFSEFGTDKILTAEQVKGMTGPFNITLGGVIWRVVCPELADHIEESADPTSDKYLSVSASWELGFSEYNIALLDGGAKNLSDAKKIITDAKEVEEAKDKLTSLGGPGKIEDLFAYRMPCNDVLPLGIGFTENPAAEVKGVLVEQEEQIGIVNKQSFDNGSKPDNITKPAIVHKTTELNKVGIVIPEAFSAEVIVESSAAEENKISQSDKINVKIERNMKITSLKDITDENLKECKASAVSDFLSAELVKGSAEWEKQKTALNTQLAEAQAAQEKFKTTQTELESKLKTVEAQVSALASEKAEREKVEKFNVRMASITDVYELDAEASAAIAEEIKAIETDEAFAKWEGRAKILFKGFAKKDDKKKAKADDDMDASKKAKADDDDDDDDADASKSKAKKAKADDDDDADASKKSKAKASEITAAVSDAVDNGKKDTGVANTTTGLSQSLKEKYAQAFAKENFVIIK